MLKQSRHMESLKMQWNRTWSVRRFVCVITRLSVSSYLHKWMTENLNACIPSIHHGLHCGRTNDCKQFLVAKLMSDVCLWRSWDCGVQSEARNVCHTRACIIMCARTWHELHVRTVDCLPNSQEAKPHRKTMWVMWMFNDKSEAC